MPGYDMRSTYSGVAHSLAMLRIPMWGYEFSGLAPNLSGRSVTFPYLGFESHDMPDLAEKLFVTNPHVGL